MAQTSSCLCGHNAASLFSRLFNSKQVLPGGKRPAAAQALGLGLFCERRRSRGRGSAGWRNAENPSWGLFLQLNVGWKRQTCAQPMFDLPGLQTSG